MHYGQAPRASHVSLASHASRALHATKYIGCTEQNLSWRARFTLPLFPVDFGSSTQLCSHALWASTACFARFACLACFACSACDKIYRMHRTKSVMASSIHTTPFFRLSVRFQFLLVPKSYTGNRLHSKLQWHYSAPLPHARNEPKTLTVRSSFLGFLPSLRLLLLILHYDCPCFQLRKVHGGHFAKWTSDILNRLEDLGVVGREP